MRWRWLAGSVAFAAMLQAAQAGQPARVVLVQPSGAGVPANLLRLSVVFAAPVEGEVLPRIALVHADGNPLPEPFLQQELWSPDGRILTLLLHPGRVKTGLIAREQWGPILRTGEEVVLTFDGRPIKRWHVGAVDADGPVASAWTLSTVRPASRQPLVVRFDAPIDGRDGDDFAILDAHDRRVDGQAELRDGEASWTFTPATAWKAGRYRLVARGTLEDAAGNRLGGHFEVPTSTSQAAASDVAVPFKVNAGP